MIKYSKVTFTLEFQEEVFFETYPTFIFKGLIGKELKKLVCEEEGGGCAGCTSRDTCVYSYLLESIVDKDNDVIRGTTKAPHPFILTVNKGAYRKPLTIFNLTVTLIGEKAIDMLPYVAKTIEMVGESGLLRKRVKFHIKDISTNGESILAEEGTLNPHVDEFVPKYIVLPLEQDKLTIKFRTPFRIESGGKLVTKGINYKKLFEHLLMRMRLLDGFYGDGKFPYLKDVYNQLSPKRFGGKIKRVRVLKYSGKQQKVAKMASVVGIFEISGEFSPIEYSLFKGGEIFNIGKNTSFGLGHYEMKILSEEDSEESVLP